jgi:hypothetical protein
MVALVALLLILAMFGGLGFAVHILWIVLIIALVLWLIGFLIGGVESGAGRRRWYRWQLSGRRAAGLLRRPRPSWSRVAFGLRARVGVACQLA